LELISGRALALVAAGRVATLELAAMLTPIRALVDICTACTTHTHAANVNTVLLYVQQLKGTGSPYSITERRVPELIPVLGSQPAGDVSHA